MSLVNIMPYEKSKNWNYGNWSGKVIGYERFVVFVSPRFVVSPSLKKENMLVWIQMVATGGNVMVAPIVGTRFAQCVLCLPDVYEN